MSKLTRLLIASLISMVTSSQSSVLALDKAVFSNTLAAGESWENTGAGSGSGSGGNSWGSSSSSSSSTGTGGSGVITPGPLLPGSTGSGSTAAGSVINGTTIPNTVTHLIISNRSGSAVTIGVQCQLPGAIVQDGCTTNISDMRILDVTPGSTGTPQQFTTYTGYNSGQGVYPLASMHQYEIVNLKTNPYSTPPNLTQNCLQGLIISFGQWNSCPAQPGNAPAFPVPFTPGPDLPNGSNAAEPSLNVTNTINGSPVAGTGATEVCDITCVNGANAIIKLTITSPTQPPSGGTQALPWLYDATGSIGAGQIFSTTNSWVNIKDKCDDNCYKIVNGAQTDRPGVFPYGCTQCNKMPDPGPPCGQFCSAQNGLAANNGCTFNRAPQKNNVATAQFGGTVEFSYTSKAVPPASCQSLGQP